MLTRSSTVDARSAGFWSYENRIVVILALAGGIGGLDILAINFLSPFVTADLHISNTKFGLIGGVSLLSWSLSAAVGARLSDRMGRRKPFLIGSFVLFAFFSAASGFATSYSTLLASRILIGLTEGPVIPIMMSIMLAESSPHRRGLNMGVVQNFGVQLIGSLLSPLILVWIATTFNWRAAFFIAGIPGLAIAAVISRFVREPPPVVPLSDVQRFVGLKTVVAEILGQRNVRLCLVIGAFTIAWYGLLLAFLPLWTIRTMGLTPKAMSVVMSLVGAAGALAAVFVSALSDKIGRRPTLGLFAMVGAIGPAVLLQFAHGVAGISAVVFVMSFMTGIIVLFMSVVPVESVAPRHAAMASALVLGGSQILGFSGPVLGGVLADRFSLAAPLWLMVGVGFSAALTSLFLKETAPAVPTRAVN